VERRGQVIRVMINLANWQQDEPTGCGGGRQPSMDGTSRVMGDYQARFCEGLGVKFPGPTRQHGDRVMPSNWRNPPRPVEKSAEQGNRISGDTGKSVDGERDSAGSVVASTRRCSRLTGGSPRDGIDICCTCTAHTDSW
jgi:hypothetical protein